jgi:hypothetical protein
MMIRPATAVYRRSDVCAGRLSEFRLALVITLVQIGKEADMQGGMAASHQNFDIT